MNYIALILVSFFVTGCAIQPQKPLYKDGATQEDFRRDSLTCRQYGMQSAMTNGLAGNMFVEIWIKDETKKCLNNLGWE